MVHVQEDRVRESDTGEGLIHESSQFTEHVFKLFKNLCAKHCNNRPGWLYHIALLHDAIVLGGLYCELVDLHAIQDHRKKVNGLVQETTATKKWDKKMIGKTSTDFQTMVKACELIKLPENPDINANECFPESIDAILNQWRDTYGAHDMHGNDRLKSQIVRIVTNNVNTQMIDTEDYDEQVDGPMSYDNFPSQVVGDNESAVSEEVWNEDNNQQLGDLSNQEIMMRLSQSNQNQNLND